MADGLRQTLIGGLLAQHVPQEPWLADVSTTRRGGATAAGKWRGLAVSQRTVRRALHRCGGRWKRPQYVLGRPDPDYAEKKGRWRRP